MSKSRPAQTTAVALEDRSLPLLGLLFSAGALAFGLYRAVSLRWISDDAFITMRYVKHFLDGHGLVYNMGERVEGYTHFLWLLLLSAAGAIGFDPVEASQWLGIAFFAGIIGLLIGISYLEQNKGNDRRLWLPLAAGIFALNYDDQIWASGGLETACYTFLILCSFYVWFYSSLAQSWRLIATGAVLTLTTLTRPDGALFLATAVALLLIDTTRRGSLRSALRSIVLLLLPAIAIGIPYLIWKYWYYGDLLPLTYYAKSSSHTYVGQGLFYVWLYFRVYFLFALAMLASAIILLRSKGVSVHGAERGSLAFAAMTACIVYLIAFVIRSGGDFMFARFIVPVVPLLLVCVERGWNAIPMAYPRLAVALLLLGGVFLENDLRSSVLFHRKDKDNDELVENGNLKGEGSTRGIVDERFAYYYPYVWGKDGTEGAMSVYCEVGKYLEPFFRGNHVTVAVPGAMNMIAYYANFHTVINEFGLTDSAIAHGPAADDARIGHEKHASEEYLVKRNVNFELVQVLNNLPQPLTTMSLAFDIPTQGVWLTARTITYNALLTHELSDRFQGMGNRSKLNNFDEIIPAYIRNFLPVASLTDVTTAYDSLQRVYFRPYPNPTWQQAFEARIRALSQDSMLAVRRTN